jgi:hypothetical protein
MKQLEQKYLLLADPAYDADDDKDEEKEMSPEACYPPAQHLVGKYAALIASARIPKEEDTE